MDPIRSSFVAGAVAAVVLAAYLFVADAIFGSADLLVYSTFASLCTISGEGYCTLGTPMATAITLFSFAVLFVVVWPLFFAGLTWGLPGESGVVHGFLYGVAMWAAYLVIVLLGVQWRGDTFTGSLPLLGITLLAYVLYGIVLGGGYDYLAEHRTLFDEAVV